MGIPSKFRVHRARQPDASVEVSEHDGLRSLHLGSTTVQSTMRLDDPVDLVLSYTRAMMGFLLFHPSPRHLLMIGLGGGSLPKFAYHRLPTARVTVVESNPRVVAVARGFFAVPEDDDRFAIVVDDGAAYVQRHAAACDVLVVDAYDGESQVEALATEAFFADAHSALERDGVLVVNLWSSDRRFDAYVQRIERAFDGRVACLPAERKGNVAVFAFRRQPEPTKWDLLRARARQLESRVGLEFPKFVEGLRQMNPHTENRLLV